MALVTTDPAVELEITSNFLLIIFNSEIKFIFNVKFNDRKPNEGDNTESEEDADIKTVPSLQETKVEDVPDMTGALTY